MPMNMNNIFNNSNQPSFFNSGQDPHQNNQNGFRCRLCNHVFPSYQALKAHFESHFTLENPAIRNLFSSSHANSQREMIPNPLQPNFPRPMVMQETRNFVNRNFQAPPQQPMVMPQYRANLFPCAIQHNVAASQPLQGPPEPQATQFVNNNVEMAQLLAPPAIHQMEMERCPSLHKSHPIALKFDASSTKIQPNCRTSSQDPDLEAFRYFDFSFCCILRSRSLVVIVVPSEKNETPSSHGGTRWSQRRWGKKEEDESMEGYRCTVRRLRME
ncbi:hypothetical protein D0Y65_027422 [Glycine soja]|uniref:C2H2-type domain-containing protein n=1 Tax=Glycine soja TaxID=3848 RepID=A0A445IP68_GLYSO|nr:hypothetical protein D0Y65_027422 [Glycine soja]